ncbi:MAG: cell surface protein SprA, partial [Chitinophagia bacterium]|nr:cell surface protein SprA [Chitinophagia bacterium]
TLRFAKLDLVRNQWRQYNYVIDSLGNYDSLTGNNQTTRVNTLAVSVEENGSRTPVNYIIPPGIERVQLLSNNGVNLLQNEQALSIQLNGLQQNASPRGVFKTMNVDVRRYGKLSMFIHAEDKKNINRVDSGSMTAIIRIGQDFQNNFYEIRIPLTTTKQKVYASSEAREVWPIENELNLSLMDLVQLKLERNKQNAPFNKKFGLNHGRQRYSVMGNPNLGEVRGILIAFENTKSSVPMDAEVWVNELRLSDLDEAGSWAALGRMDLTLADLGTLAVSVNSHTSGFGSIEQKMNERAKTGLTQFDIATNIDAGKLLPKQARISLPVFASINKTMENPQFDPFEKDILYKDKINSLTGSRLDSVKKASIDQTTIKTINFTNVRFLPGKNPSLISLSNFDFSYSYSQLLQSSPVITQNKIDKQRGAIGYTFNKNGKSYEPFKKLIKSNSPWLTWVKEINVNPTPNLISYRAVFDRQFGEFIPRVVNSFDGTTDRVDTTYDKYFTMSRLFNLRWSLTRSLHLDLNANMNSRIDEPAGRIDTKEKKDSLMRMLLQAGRNTLYTQRATLRYDIPTNKFPLTDWIMSSYNVSTNYNWVGASRLAQELGNTIENTFSQQLNAQFNFTNFYNKSKILRSALSTMPNQGAQNAANPLSNRILMTKDEALQGKKGKERMDALKKWREARRQERIAQRVLKANEPVNFPEALKPIVRFLMMLKTASVDYAENYNSRLPGYMSGVNFMNSNWDGFAPGMEYAFGKQPDSSWLRSQENKGLLSKDDKFNLMFRQGFDQKFNARVQLEPLNGFMIDIQFNKTFTKNYSELFKDTSGTGIKSHLNPLSAGGFTISYFALNTFFDHHDPNELSKVFKTFEANRVIISNRVAEKNPYWDTKKDPNGYAIGYGKYSQDVLIPAFIAAYTGKNPHDVSLLNQNNANIKSSPFSGLMPMPNWNLSYSGLSKLPGISSLFSNITLTHGYNGSLAMNSFTSSLMYADRRFLGAPSFIDPISGNYIPYFLVPNITISERMEPLIGVNVTTLSQWSLRFEYKKSRLLALSLVDYQLSENNSKEWVFGTSYRARGLKLPFQIPGLNNNKLANDLTFRLDVGLRDMFNSNSRLDQANAYGTGGSKEITLQPSIDYVLNSKINLKFFFDQRRTTPYISSSPPIITTRAGVNVRIAL